MRSISLSTSSAWKGWASALLLVLVSLSLSMAGSSAAAEKEKRGKRDATLDRCLAIDVLSPQSIHHRGRHRFSATEILDLEFRVDLPGPVSGAHRLDIKVYTPDGQLYETLTVPFRDNEEGAGRTAASAPRNTRRRSRKLSDYPQPIPEVEVESRGTGRNRRAEVSATLPVAGTSIVWSSLYGRWTAEAFLDGSMSSCAAPTRFFISE